MYCRRAMSASRTNRPFTRPGNSVRRLTGNALTMRQHSTPLAHGITLRLDRTRGVRTALILASVIATVVCLFPSPAKGATLARSAEQSMAVSLQQPVSSVPSDGKLLVSVAVDLSQASSSLQITLRLYSASGECVYKQTEVHTHAPRGRSVITYECDISSLDLAPGRYSLKVDAQSTGTSLQTVTGRVFVIDPDASPIPVAVVVRYTQIPAVNFDGAFAIDPSLSVMACDTLTSIMQLARTHDAPVSLVIAPVTLDEFARAASGYETSAGVTVSASENVPQSYATLITELTAALATGTIDLLDAPYALPDLAESTTAITAQDLSRQWTRTDNILESLLGSTTASSTAYLGSVITSDAAQTLNERGDIALLVPEGAVYSQDSTAQPGCYVLEGSDIRVLVADEDLAAAALEGPAAFYDAIFDYSATQGAVILVDIGAGASYSQADVEKLLNLVTSTPWLTLTSVDDIGTDAELDAVYCAPTSTSTAPSDYWTDVSEARSAVLAFVSAAGNDNTDAAEALRAILVAESSLSAGDDDTWPSAAVGLKAARDAKDYVLNQFKLVQLDVKDTTLSGRSGEVPITIVNGTDKQLTLTLVAESSKMSIDTTSTTIRILPDENFLTIPVDLGNEFSGELYLTLEAGDMTITETTVVVEASYLDRLATVGMVVIVLVGLLFYIRRHARPPGSNIGENDAQAGPKNTDALSATDPADRPGAPQAANSNSAATQSTIDPKE